jgi:hypothetical protein
MKRPLLKGVPQNVVDYVMDLEDQVESLERCLRATEDYQPVEVRLAKIIEELGFKRG